MRNGIALVNRMARGLCNVFPGLALALRSKPGNLFAKLGHFLLAFRVLVEAAHPDLADAVRVHPICQEELYSDALGPHP